MITAFAASTAMLFLTSAAVAQRQPPTPDQRLERLERLEKQMQQLQRQVFPKGRPADTAGFSDEPAATQSSVITLDQRLDALERQVADMLRQTEENGNRLQSLQSDLGRLRTDQEQRVSTLEQRMNDAAAVAPVSVVVPPGPAAQPAKPRPQTTKPNGGASAETAPGGTAATALGDPGEDAYTEAFRLWESGQDDAAITAFRAFTSAYPRHRRVSYANNLVGRALLDKGEARAAAEALLANYRNNPKGERAADSLYYLGQALMKLGRPGQACKAYSELDAVYGGEDAPAPHKQGGDSPAPRAGQQG